MCLALWLLYARGWWMERVSQRSVGSPVARIPGQKARNAFLWLIACRLPFPFSPFHCSFSSERAMCPFSCSMPSWADPDSAPLPSTYFAWKVALAHCQTCPPASPTTASAASSAVQPARGGRTDGWVCCVELPLPSLSSPSFPFFRYGCLILVN